LFETVSLQALEKPSEDNQTVREYVRRRFCFWHNSVQRKPALVLGNHLPSHVRENLPCA